MPRAAKNVARKSEPARDAHGEALRERIMRGAASAFGRLGYTETRVEDIVADTGISRPTFYKVFESKDAVFEALSARHHAGIRARLSEAAESTDDPVLKLERIIEGFLRWRAELGPVGRVLDLEARGPSQRLSGDRARTLAFVIQLGQTELSRSGRPEVDPVLLRALVAAAENVADELFGEPPVSERTFQRAKAIALRVHAAAVSQPGDLLPPLPLSPRPASRSRRGRRV